jgi:hypothetical protein
MNITRDPKTGKFHARQTIKANGKPIYLVSFGISPTKALMGIVKMVVYYAHENNVHPDVLTPEN